MSQPKTGRIINRTPKGLGDYDTWAASLGLEDCSQPTVGDQWACVQRNDAKISAWGNSPDQVDYQSNVAASEAANMVQWGVPAQTIAASINTFIADNPSVTPSSVAQAVQQNTQQPTTTTAGGQQTTKTYNPSIQLVNATRGVGQPFVVGDGFIIYITNAAPNVPVTASSTQNGVSRGSQSFGSTDSSGSFSISGTMDASTVGSWREDWQVGPNALSISFSVGTPSTNQTTSQNNTTNSTNTTSQNDNTTTGTNLYPTETVNPSGTNWLSLLLGGGSMNSQNNTSTSQPTTSGSSFMTDFETGFSELFSPSSWGTVISSGNAAMILGLIALPTVAAMYVFSKKGRR